VNRGTEQEECVGQFNLIVHFVSERTNKRHHHHQFVDDLSLFAQSLGESQTLLNVIQEFELWCGLKFNRKKTCVMVIERLGVGQRQSRETIVYSWDKW
jgi:hypothetical protein